MSKGLKLTLATVAFAILGFNAMATAPVISGIPDLQVGDETTGTYDYPDAVDLTTKVTDDVTPTTGILWSFFDASGVYTLNGAASNAGDLVNPAGGALVAGPGGDFTVTYANATPSAGSSGDTVDVASLLYYASDGTTVSAPFGAQVWTVLDGNDMTSGGGLPPLFDYDFTVSNGGWTFTAQVTDNLTNSSAGALSMGCTLAGNALGYWQSPVADAWQVVDDTVYEIVADVSVALGAGELPPVLDWVVVNQYFDSGSSSLVGLFTFWSDTWFIPRGDLGNPSTATGIYDATENPSGVQEHRIYFTPACVNNPAWIAALGDPTEAAKAVAMLQWRLLDLDSVAANIMSILAGTVSMTSLSIKTATQVDNVTVTGSLLDLTPATELFVATGSAGTGAAAGNSLLLTIDNLGSGGFGQLNIGPGNVDATGAAAYPVAWSDDEIMLFSVDLVAPTAGDAADPPHVVRLFVESPGLELLAENNASSQPNALAVGGGATPTTPAMPGTTAAAYVHYLYSHNASTSSDIGGVAGNSLRPYVNIFSFNGLGGTWPTSTSGDLQIDSFTVETVTIQ